MENISCSLERHQKEIRLFRKADNKRVIALKKISVNLIAAALILVVLVGIVLYASRSKPAAETAGEVPAISYEEQKLEERYANGQAAMERGDWEWALGIFTSLGNYADSVQQAEAAQAKIDALEAQRLADAYAAAEALEQAEDFDGAAEAFLELEDYSDSATRALACWYLEGELQESLGNRGAAAIAFGKAGDYWNARARSLALWDQVAVRNTITAGFDYTVALAENGTLLHTRRLQLKEEYQSDPSRLGTIIAVDGLLCLRDDGTVINPWTRETALAEEVSTWRNIVSISDGMGLKSDGTVVQSSYASRTYVPFTDQAKWRDLVAIDGNCGLHADGTVLEVGGIFCTYNQWTDVKAIACGNGFLIALRGDGTLYAEDLDEAMQTDKTGLVQGIDHVVSLSTGEATRHWAVVSEDGSVLAWGDNDWGQCNTQDWTDIVAVAVGAYHTVGLKRDGTLVSTGANYNDEYYEDLGKYGEPYICWGQSDVEGWRVSMGTQPPDDLSCTPEQAIAQLEERQPLWSSLFSEPFDTSGGQPRDNLAAGENGAIYWTRWNDYGEPIIIRNTGDTAATVLTVEGDVWLRAMLEHEGYLYFLMKEMKEEALYRIPAEGGTPELLRSNIDGYTGSPPYCIAGNTAFVVTDTGQLLAISLDNPEEAMLIWNPQHRCKFLSLFPADNGLVLLVSCHQEDRDILCWLYLSKDGVSLLDLTGYSSLDPTYFSDESLHLYRIAYQEEAFEICRVDGATGRKKSPIASLSPEQNPARRAVSGEMLTFATQCFDEENKLWETFYALDLRTGAIRELLRFPHTGSHNVSHEQFPSFQPCGDDLYLSGYHVSCHITRYRGIYAGAAPVEEGFSHMQRKWTVLEDK